MKTYRDFFTDVLAGLGIEPYKHSLYALAAVTTLEGLNDRYNPLNSVVPYGDSTDYNSVHVQDYKSYENGVAGTVELLKGSPWVNVVQAMRENKSSRHILAAFKRVYATWNAHPTFPANHLLLDEAIDGNHARVVKPGKPRLRNPTRVPDGTRVYTVKKTDTDGLYGIASRELGKAGRWQEIATFNKIIAPWTIHAGDRLLIPTE